MSVYQNISTTFETASNKTYFAELFASHLKPPTTFDVEFLYFFILMKKFNRGKKGTPDFLATSLTGDEFVHFLKEYELLGFSEEHKKPIFIIIQPEETHSHKNFIIIQKINAQNTNILFISTASSDKYLNIFLDYIRKIKLNSFHIYSYNSVKSPIQTSPRGCSWFCLEHLFTLSKSVTDLNETLWQINCEDTDYDGTNLHYKFDVANTPEPPA